MPVPGSVVGAAISMAIVNVLLTVSVPQDDHDRSTHAFICAGNFIAMLFYMLLALAAAFTVFVRVGTISRNYLWATVLAAVFGAAMAAQKYLLLTASFKTYTAIKYNTLVFVAGFAAAMAYFAWQAWKEAAVP
jgi:hypothetical protein